MMSYPDQHGTYRAKPGLYRHTIAANAGSSIRGVIG